MSGPTLTMAPAAVEAPTPTPTHLSFPPFNRSHSSPNLLGLSASTPLRELNLTTAPPVPVSTQELGLKSSAGGRSPTTSSGTSPTTRLSPSPGSNSTPSSPISPRDPQHHRTLSLKTVPSLPAFDVASFDLGAEFETSLRLDTGTGTGPVDAEKAIVEITREAAGAGVAITTPPTITTSAPKTPASTTIAAAVVAESDKLESEHQGRKKPMVEQRRHSWLPASRSALNVRELVKRGSVVSSASPPAESTKAAGPGSGPGAGATGDSLQTKRLPRSKTVESFADFARLSWKSRSRSPSRSPSPSSRVVSAGDKGRVKVEAEADNEGSRSPFKSKVTRKLAGSTGKTAGKPSGVTEPDNSTNSAGGAAAATAEPTNNTTASTPSPKTKTRNRASVYLTRIKQKPATVFSKSASSLSSSTDANPSTTDKEEEYLSTAPSVSIPTPNSAADTPAPPASATAPTTPAGGLTLSHQDLSSLNKPRNSSHTSSSTSTSTASSATASSENASNATRDSGDTGITMPHPTSRDPLWSAFRVLDTEFPRFVAKTSTAGRMASIRGALIPFLRETAHHTHSSPQNKLLSFEDIDRRATILNKWWNALLEMLDGSHATRMVGANGAILQPVAGVDRPTLFEVTTMIMMRPEWRMCTSAFQRLSDRCPAERVRARSGTQSTNTTSNAANNDSDRDSSDASFLAESAEHNVRTMFQANLFAQMALVVDKMSQRHAPLSLVNWCGKACAYAFFFCPGIADVLVRLWVLNAELLRRAAEELGLPLRNAKSGRAESEDIVALFPPALGSLGWTSVKAMGHRLRRPARLPLMPTFSRNIQWHGPWVTRWRGGDTDLFFLFCKYYFVLAEEFMPAGLPLVEKARAPGFVLVQAQLLATLDTTIHRQASLEAAAAAMMMGPPLPDALSGGFGVGGGADAALMPPMALPSNLLRGMDENRLVVLLKDMLSEQGAGAGSGNALAQAIRHTFAQAFVCTMKAATRRTSKYEHSAHFVLCEFLEEALGVLHAYQNELNTSVATSPRESGFLKGGEVEKLGRRDSDYISYGSPGGPANPVDYIDWTFWLDVAKMMLNSNNTMSEIRLLSFVFAVWDPLVADPRRKKAICVDWLLSEEVFEKFFNNWCPMVRAYYMRLLCWRICRDEGSANDLDTNIFLLVSHRLKTVWSHYLWLKQTAESQNRLPPVTAPSLPSPGKRFLIVKTELPPVQTGLLLGFDTTSSSFPSRSSILGQHQPTGRTSPDSTQGSSNGAGGSTSKQDSTLTSYRKKWSLLGKVLSFTAAQANGLVASTNVGANVRRGSWEDEQLELARRETAHARASSTSSSTNNRTFAGILSQIPGPPTPPKQTGNANGAPLPSSDSSSSTGSSPVYDVAQIVFRFTLASAQPAQPFVLAGPTGPGGPAPPGSGNGNGVPSMPPQPSTRERILSRPRLPAPAQARVSTRTAAAYAAAANAAAARRGRSGAVNPSLPPFRSESPPPIAPGLPPETRRFSGVMQTGLVSEARNAKPLQGRGRRSGGEKRLSFAMTIRAVPKDPLVETTTTPSDSDSDDPDRLPINEPSPALALEDISGDGQLDFEIEFERALDRGENSSSSPSSDNDNDNDNASSDSGSSGSSPDDGEIQPELFLRSNFLNAPIPLLGHGGQVHPVQPKGIYVAGGAYTGRALAEWSLVVGECNSFMDRRREEGVLGLRDVEVPSLGVEGMGGMRARA